MPRIRQKVVLPLITTITTFPVMPLQYLLFPSVRARLFTDCSPRRESHSVPPLPAIEWSGQGLSTHAGAVVRPNAKGSVGL
jgi:hypothetical protein